MSCPVRVLRRGRESPPPWPGHPTTATVSLASACARGAAPRDVACLKAPMGPGGFGRNGALLKGVRCGAASAPEGERRWWTGRDRTGQDTRRGGGDGAWPVDWALLTPLPQAQRPGMRSVREGQVSKRKRGRPRNSKAVKERETGNGQQLTGGGGVGTAGSTSLCGWDGLGGVCLATPVLFRLSGWCIRRGGAPGSVEPVCVRCVYLSACVRVHTHTQLGLAMGRLPACAFLQQTSCHLWRWVTTDT